MPNVTRGDSMVGLMAYLAGPGRTNEHTEPHLVAGSEHVMAWHDDAVLDHAGALAVGRDVDAVRRAYAAGGVRVSGGSVWHCSLSLRAEEGQLDDGTWAAVSRDFVAAMGFADPPPGASQEEGSGRAPCSWVAVRHGLSSAGNDHVHVAVSLVREDGTKASVSHDWARAQRVANRLEHRYGLVVLESREVGVGARGVKPAEVARAARQGAAETDRQVLARQVRALAGASSSEADFVGRLRKAGLWVRPRYAHGRDDVVAGYAVALPPARATTAGGSRGAGVGERPVFYGGGHLARDLTLPRLRAAWPDTAAGAAEAAALWRAARREQPAAGPRAAGRDRPAVRGSGWVTGRGSAADWDACVAEVQVLRSWLAGIPATDHAGWAHAARQAAGALAAWSQRVEAMPGPLAKSADALARYGQVRAHTDSPHLAGGRRVPRPSLRGTTLLLLTAVDGGRGTTGQVVLLRQLASTLRAVHDAHLARGHAQAAAALEATVRGDLTRVLAEATAAARASGTAISAPQHRLASPEPQQERAGERPLVAPGPEASGPGGVEPDGERPLDAEASEAARLARTGTAQPGTSPTQPAATRSPLPPRLDPGGRQRAGTAGRRETGAGRDREIER